MKKTIGAGGHLKNRYSFKNYFQKADDYISPDIDDRTNGKLPYEYLKNSEKYILSHLKVDSNKNISNKRVYLKDLSFVEKYTYCLIDYLKNSTHTVEADGVLSDNFYLKCASIYEELFDDEVDKDLLVIYAKQIMMMLKKSSVVSFTANEIHISDFDRISFKDMLFKTLWNQMDWSDLFPSMPDLARNMMDNRFLIKDLLFDNKESFLIDDLVNDYLVISGEDTGNSLLKISFFDFSLFSWLRNFNVLRYVSYPGDSRVFIEFTEDGRLFFSKNTI